MTKVPQIRSAPSNMQHQSNFTYICCYEVISSESQGTMKYLDETGLRIDVLFTARRPRSRQQNYRKNCQSIKLRSSTPRPATYSPELKTCTARLHLRHETCWWRTHRYGTYHIYQNATSSHTYTPLYWNDIWKSLLMKKVPQFQSSPSHVQYHFNHTYICWYEAIWVVYQENNIFTWCRSYSLMFSSPYDNQ